MSVTINPPKTPVTAGSNGIAAATLPNVCKMPGPPAPFVPTPLPNIGKSGNSPQGYSKDVTIGGHPVAIQGATFKSMGDVASQGTGGGLISSNVEGPTSFVGPGSLDVKIEGKNVQLLSDPMLNNGGPSGTRANSGTMEGIIQASGLVIAVDEMCPICEEKNHGKLEETPQSKIDAGNLAAKFEAEVKKVSGKASTMLGIVQCLCGQKFADQSGATTIELCEAASGMKHPAGVTHSVANRSDNETRRTQSIEDVKRRSIALMNGSSTFLDAWDECDALASASWIDSSDGAAYRPGSCAAQKILLAVREDGAIAKIMTEQWFSTAARATASPIAFIDAGKDPPEPTVRPFAHGATVPPCKTCLILVPLLLCPGDKTQCTHAT